jgi:hypothetical protein
MMVIFHILLLEHFDSRPEMQDFNLAGSCQILRINLVGSQEGFRFSNFVGS